MSLWKIRQNADSDEFEFFVPEYFRPGTTGGNSSGEQAEKPWWSALDVQAIFTRLSQPRSQGYLHAFGWAQLFHKFFPPGAIISVGTQVEIPHLLSTASRSLNDFAGHPLTVATQRIRDGGDEEDEAGEAEDSCKLVGYVKPDITVVTIDTSRLRDHYYRALLYWQVKTGSELNKGFVQVVWALLLGSTLHDTRFAGLATGRRFMRIRMDPKGRIGVDTARTDVFTDRAEREGLAIEEFLAKARLKHARHFPFELTEDPHEFDEVNGNVLFYDYCVALGNHVFDHFHGRPETPPVDLDAEGLDSVNVSLAQEMDRVKNLDGDKDSIKKESGKRIAETIIDPRIYKKARIATTEPVKRDGPRVDLSRAGSALGSSTGLGHGGNAVDDTTLDGTDPDDRPGNLGASRFPDMKTEPVNHDGTRDDDSSSTSMSMPVITAWERNKLQRQLETEFNDTDWEVFHKLKHIRVWPYEVLFPQPQEWYV
ncbi:hypothetical protein FFLO_03573 [Filobasidium floriforme]|uniref:Uncharacterized protein n=1 Tax=Filobasidium floriforme TaxID=5210 RepID=A0A8K0NQQ9_9TREE|nr:hypothetical protein FFLO_03573 [Filobasidium floriforme]